MMHTLVIGVGVEHCGDDGIGPVVAREVRRLRPDAVAVCECRGEATQLMFCWRGWRRVVIVDAATGVGLPGSVRRLDVNRDPLPTSLRSASTHGWGVAEAVELARALGELPARLVVYAIEGASFEPGTPLTPQVAAAVADLASAIVRRDLENARPSGRVRQVVS